MDGDLVGTGSSESDWSVFFNKSYTFAREFMSRIPIDTAMGNHELIDTDIGGDAYLQHLRLYFPIPAGDSTGTGRNGYFYYITYGKAFIIFIDHWNNDNIIVYRKGFI